MPKQKTRKAVAKRFKVTGRGKIKRAGAGGSHLLTGKNRKQKRRLKASTLVADADHRRIMENLPR